MEIKTLEISGLYPTLAALRLPFGKEPRSKRNYSFERYYYDEKIEVIKTDNVTINPDDLKLMNTLVKRGDEHAKTVRGIVVYAEITAPIYYMREIETYRAGRERLSSSSTMHIDCKGLYGEELQAAKAAIPMGKECTTIDSFSYQCLRNIVKQRNGHRLPEWQQFVEWVKTLPFADDLILAGLELNK